MSYIQPNSEVRLLTNVKLDNRYEHTGYFANIQTQTDKFLSKTYRVLNDYTFQRYTDNQIKVELPINECMKCQYMMFKNTSHGDKWFYAFITEVTYINEETTLLTYELDDIQTWYFETSFNQCMVEREHTSSDKIGEHILDENLPCGDYVSYNSYPFYDVIGDDKWVIVIATNETSSGASGSGGLYGGVYQGCRYVYHNFDDDGINKVNDFINRVVESGQEESIVFIFLIPKIFYTPKGSKVGVSEVCKVLKDYTAIDDYIPRNNKLYCYPYNLLYVFNQQGSSATYRYELFTQDIDKTTCQFTVSSSADPNMVVYITPMRYGQNKSNDYDNCITFNGAVQCSFNTDYYKAWLAQNNANMSMAGVGVIASGLGVAGSIATGGVLPLMATGGLAVSTILKVGNIYADMKTASIQPPQLNGNVSNGILKSLSRMCPMYCRKTVTYAYAKMIDEYFTKFGYKVNTLKTPSVNNRPNYTYIKTVGCDITGNCPQNAIQHANAIHDNGITYWTNIDNIGNYSLNNSV